MSGDKIAALIGLEMIVSAICGVIAVSDLVPSGSRAERVLFSIFTVGWLTPPLGGAALFCIYTLLR